MNPAAGAAKTKDGAVELFRWLCILSVLLHHSIFPSRQSPRTLDAIFEAKELLSWCVTGFFFVSGWLSRPETFGLRSVAERARRLLVPFACINAAVCAVNRSPVSCIPSPESPANRITTRSTRSTVPPIEAPSLAV